MSTQTKLTRRQFMTGCSAAIAALAGSQVSSLAFTPDAPNPEAIIIVFLRGGWDALNVVPPIAAGPDRGYYPHHGAPGRGGPADQGQGCVPDDGRGIPFAQGLYDGPCRDH